MEIIRFLQLQESPDIQYVDSTTTSRQRRKPHQTSSFILADHEQFCSNSSRSSISFTEIPSHNLAMSWSRPQQRTSFGINDSDQFSTFRESAGRMLNNKPTSFVVAIESPLSQHLACNRGVFKAKFDLQSGTFSGAITQGGKVTAQVQDGQVTGTEIEETPASKSADAQTQDSEGAGGGGGGGGGSAGPAVVVAGGGGGGGGLPGAGPAFFPESSNMGWLGVFITFALPSLNNLIHTAEVNLGTAVAGASMTFL